MSGWLRRRSCLSFLSSRLMENEVLFVWTSAGVCGGFILTLAVLQVISG